MKYIHLVANPEATMYSINFDMVEFILLLKILVTRLPAVEARGDLRRDSDA